MIFHLLFHSMPYITPTARERLDTAIDTLAALINLDDRAGELNYSITRLLLAVQGDARYRDLNELIGALECAKLELYRRKAAPYEDKKIAENGDLTGFSA